MSRRSYFVAPDTVRLDLSEGDWVEVKKGLSYGERAHVRALLYGRLPEGGTADAGIDIEAAAVEFLAAWIVDWSFTEGDPPAAVPVSRDAIRALDPDLADEVQAAIAAHVQEIERGKALPNSKPRRAARSAS